jgi:Mn-dependent DtxR family transcriptional regulator
MRKKVSKKKTPARVGRVAAQLRVLPALTKKQGECLLFIFNYYAERRHFPTHREIAQAMGIQSSTAAMYLDPLVEKGYLMREGREARNIRITTDGIKRLRMMGVSV